jgi:hypothetical protein
MLIIQAHTLDAIFNTLARRANAAEYLPQFEAYLRLGLKAQGQCRATLETLAEIKYPKPVAFVQQANVANGPQQVNNAPQPAADTISRARESETSPNELFGALGGLYSSPYYSRVSPHSNAMNGWTAERRTRQGAAIHRWKPWERSTGPKTTEGKARAPAMLTAALCARCFANWRKSYGSRGTRSASGAFSTIVCASAPS